MSGEERRLTEYPFPLDDGTTAFLRLPKTGITQNESARLQEFIYALVVDEVYETTDMLTREKAANAMMAFLNEHGGDVGQHWPTMEDALKWLESGDESA